jgi:hypothetical protein
MSSLERSTLGGAKDEYAARFIQVLAPQMHKGIRDIFNEAVAVCRESGEEHKYLMTFQNFLAKVPTWSAATVEKEAKRIEDDSGCTYMPELLACVHVAHLKLLTSIRPSETSREVEIPMPTLVAFVHKAYSIAARKLWKHTFLFETGIFPLEQQKNAREVDVVLHNSIVEAVRDSLPVDDILKNYLRGVEEVVPTPMPSSPAVVDGIDGIDGIDDSYVAPAATHTVIANVEAPDNGAPVSLNIETQIAADNDGLLSGVPAKPDIITHAQLGSMTAVEVVKQSSSTLRSSPPSSPSSIRFTDADSVLDMGTNTERQVSAPKDISSLDNKVAPLHGAAFPPEDDGSLTISGATAPKSALDSLMVEL